MRLSSRSTQPETMDDESTDLATYQRCLGELAVVNRMTFTHYPTIRWLACATAAIPPGGTVTVLDVACGHGDLSRAIATWARRRGLKVRLSGIDANPRSTAIAREVTPQCMDIEYRTADVFEYAFTEQPDFIVSSHFTHHLSDDDVVKFLSWLDENAGRGWHIVDLQRHALPYYSFPALARVMRWHRILREDGVISIARSFRRDDWRTYLDRAGMQADISWNLFRLCVSQTKGRN
ncbi:methyltransferase domain-containing protein [Mycobacterium sp. 94-17]|uniref:methyltransferase domain-containing protein n=1 Tax=Mycobacterium sp. 94-17 TaxID=2986147 RepID=UPI002D1EDCA2|nr:methyltransferase domain-containing protein [Mycobacterium sp. 94-17]MEB4210889.1 methyltransferase domain-containing protein [Mycobacterium sp. 94-17]